MAVALDLMSVKIYLLRTTTSEDVYVGSTRQLLRERMDHHRSNRKIWLKGRNRYCSSFPLVADPTCVIELLEECDASVRRERERHWIRITPHCINQFKLLDAEEYAESKKARDRRNQRTYRERKKAALHVNLGAVEVTS